MLRDRKTWPGFMTPARKRSGSILTTRSPHGAGNGAGRFFQPGAHTGQFIYMIWRFTVTSITLKVNCVLAVQVLSSRQYLLEINSEIYCKQTTFRIQISNLNNFQKLIISPSISPENYNICLEHFALSCWHIYIHKPSHIITSSVKYIT